LSKINKKKAKNLEKCRYKKEKIQKTQSKNENLTSKVKKENKKPKKNY
jgi:hypothetical protein